MFGRKIIRSLALTLFALFILVTGCSDTEKTDDVKGPLKVMFFNESNYLSEFGELFAIKYPNVQVEVVDTQSIYNFGGVTDYNQGVRDLIEKEQPDIVLLNENLYEDMVDEAKLVELDTLIERDRYNTDTIYPAVLELLKIKGGGKLYGLSPTFYKNVIYYNADLFKKHGIDPPRDGMTWEELLKLAQRFPSEGDEGSRVYGFGLSYDLTPSALVQLISYTEGLTEVNPESLKVTVNTESWKKVFELAVETLEANALHESPNIGSGGGSMADYFNSRPFLVGRMAMTLDSPYLLRDLKDARDMVGDYKPFKVGMAAAPADPADRGATRDLYLSNIFAIRNGTSNADAAWAFLKYISGEEYAKAKSKTLNASLLSRINDNMEVAGYDLEVFYKLKPKVGLNIYSETDRIPAAFFPAYREIVDREIRLVREKSKTLDAALQTIQDEGQLALDNAVKDRELNEEANQEETLGNDAN